MGDEQKDLIEQEDVLMMTDDDFMKKYSRLVYYYVNKYFSNIAKAIEQETNLNMDDLIQSGMLGLVTARRDFKTELGFKFTTFAVPRILGYIRKAVRDSQKIRITNEVYEIKGKISRMKLHDEEVESIAKLLEVSVRDVKTAKEFNPRTISLQTPLNKEVNKEKVTLENTLIDKKTSMTLDDVIKKMIITAFLSTLCSKEKFVWELHAKNMTQAAIGKRLGVTQTQISRILKGIYKKAEEYGNKHSLRDIGKTRFEKTIENHVRQSSHGNWLDIAESNGVSRGAFWYRLREGWSYEMAATQPLGSQGTRKNKQVI
ncbi:MULTISPECIES: sigma-70 family RNA polymerase sigma factor [Bacillus]|nr:MULTISPECIES: sigma-70 family RNA polymerase sigma factor [Bacillus]EJT21795.1 Prophage LambdaBa02, RNA polymerase sigma-F factor [Bacillus anthracis str. UR-1]EXJ18690.1 RNA polymerase subunit sigma-28 [Bacillus anthracis str. 95014]AAT56124.1 prophage LambdaBa02, RNA polymerase sigma-F factor, putative [Bacillus anthracis str. Sterne]ACP16488.1 putative prophage LambdaBa02, RNA polymerase sigma-F factor [Bacillus anthracis str. CDC 684]ACQ46612.1 putative prophage LambdaBa02, RNA polymera